MKIRLSRKGQAILSIILSVIVLGSGSYLVWRVNQEESTSPEESEAGTGGGGTCTSNCSCNVCVLPNGTYSGIDQQRCYDQNGSWENDCEGHNSVSSPSCYRLNCGGGIWVTNTDENYCDTCGAEQEDDDECGNGSDCPACKWPNVGYCDKSKNPTVCTCKQWDSFTTPACNYGNSFDCSATCTTAKPIECGTDHTGCRKIQKDCTCPQCLNKTYDTIWCKANTCSGEAWITKPSGTKNKCSNITAVAEASDADGISESSINVKLGSTAISKCTSSTSSNCYKTSTADSKTKITINVNDSKNCLTEGSYTLSVSWSDALGNSGDACALSTSFTIANSCGDGVLDTSAGEQCESGNPTGVSCTWDTCNQTTCLCPNSPSWNITKSGIESCVENGTEVEGNVAYVISVSNTGSGEGSLDKVVDTLDSKVIADYIHDMSGNGTYTSGQIIWDLEGDDEIFSVGETQTFTYNIQVPSSAFGTYTNTATAYPIDYDSISAQEIVEVDCVIEDKEIPETGIFDNNAVRIASGVILIILGLNWNKVDRGLRIFTNGVREGIDTRKSIAFQNRLRKFEKKVEKKK